MNQFQYSNEKKSFSQIRTVNGNLLIICKIKIISDPNGFKIFSNKYISICIQYFFFRIAN